MDNVNMTWLNGTLAGKIVKQLDSMDSKQNDGKIDASIWNKFMGDKGGKTISEGSTISMNEAMVLITKLALNDAAKAKKNGNANATANTVAKDYLNKLKNSQTQNNTAVENGSVTGDPAPADNTAPAENGSRTDNRTGNNTNVVADLPTPEPKPANDTNPPKAKTPPKAEVWNKQVTGLAGQEITTANGQKMKYDENGYLMQITNPKTESVTIFSRDKNGKVTAQKTRDKNGNETSYIKYNENGAICLWREKSFKDGKCISMVGREPNGTVAFKFRYNYNEDSSYTRINYDPDGSVICCSEFDKVGHETNRTCYNNDGSISSVWRDDGMSLCYENGKPAYYVTYNEETKEWTKYHMDGTPFEDGE